MIKICEIIPKLKTREKQPPQAEIDEKIKKIKEIIAKEKKEK